MIKLDKPWELTQDISCRYLLQLLQLSAHQQIEPLCGTTGQMRHIGYTV